MTVAPLLKRRGTTVEANAMRRLRALVVLGLLAGLSACAPGYVGPGYVAPVYGGGHKGAKA